MESEKRGRKRLIVAGLIAFLVFAATFGFAASLGGITGGTLGADDAVVASCDTNGVTVGYATAYNTSGTDGYKVASVTVGGIDDACDGLDIGVVLTDSAGTSLESVSGTVPVGAGTSATLALASTTLAADVEGVHVVIAD